MADIIYQSGAPDSVQFAAFRENCGWGAIDRTVAQAAIANSLHFECAHAGGDLVGFGRVIGDGALNFYIQDLIVAEDARGQGIGARLLERLLDVIKETAPAGATIGLMAAAGKEAFYQRFGFECRPNIDLGAGMTLVTE